VDFWAFNAHDLSEYMGMEHCRAFWSRLYQIAGDSMLSNRRRPILAMTEDTSPGRHDTLIAPCDNERYGLPGCTDNMTAAATVSMPGWPHAASPFSMRQALSTCS
jgi:hypothetical protein